MPVEGRGSRGAGRLARFRRLRRAARRAGPHRGFVEAQFDQIFSNRLAGDPCGNGNGEEGAAAWVWSGALADDGEDEALNARLAGLGFVDPDAVLARLRGVWRSSRYAGLPESSRQRFDRVRAARARRRLGHRRRASRRHRDPLLRPAGDGRAARRLPGAAHRVSRRARSRAVGAGRDALGRRLPDPPSAVARRAARRRGDRQPVDWPASRTRCARGWPRRRHGTADGPAAPRAARRGVPDPADRPGGQALGGARQRPALGAGRRGARRHARGGLGRSSPSGTSSGRASR